jgi:hypothetical protein
MICPSASWCACVRAAASMRIRPPRPRPDDRGGRALAFAGDVPTTWPGPASRGQLLIRSGLSPSVAWAACHTPDPRHLWHTPTAPARAWHAHAPRSRPPAACHQTAAAPLVLLVRADPIPPDLAAVWRAYLARCSREQTFRFFKQTLRWTTPQLRSHQAANRLGRLAMTVHPGLYSPALSA